MPPKVSPLAVIPHASTPVKLIWLYGRTGSGKSLYIHRNYPTAFIKGPDSKWNGYGDQPVVAIEDFNLNVRRGFQQLFVQWLTGEDIPAYISPYKKKFIHPSTFIVTSYYHPLDFKYLKPAIKSVLSNCEIIHCNYPRPPPRLERTVTISIPSGQAEPLPSSSDDDEEEELPSTPELNLSDADEDSQINFI